MGRTPCSERYSPIYSLRQGYCKEHCFLNRKNDYNGRIFVRCYAELNDLLPEKKRGQELVLPLRGPRTTKDALESLNIPHTEVDLILVNRESVGFERLLHDQDRLACYPMFEAFDITPVQHLRPRPLRCPVFICDVHLGVLARRMRLLGCDVSYRNDLDDAVIIEIQEQERRAILTRDRNLLRNHRVRWGCLIRSSNPDCQLEQVLHRFDLSTSLAPFTRCSRCNGLLKPVEREKILKLLPPRVALERRSFHICPNCGQVYWKGSHYRRLQEWVRRLLNQYDGAS